MKRTLLFILIHLLLISSVSGQLLNGHITERETGKPLDNASIIVLPSNRQERSDAGGNFSIQAKPTDTVLKVTNVGYITESVSLKNGFSNGSIISLARNSNTLEEVRVSSGYQQLPKERATGSFSTIDNTTFNQQVGPTILQRLPAIANGLIMDNSTNAEGRLMIRGLSTINGPKSPLIVLDNFPYEGDINNINPNDVENITILKDAAASSIWGARAGNGVIVITTKKGSKNSPLHIEANINSSIGMRPDLSYIRQMSSEDYIGVEEMLFDNGHYTDRINSPSMPPLTPVVELLLRKQNGQIDAEEYRRQIALLKTVDIRSEFEKEIYRPSAIGQYYFSLRGGTAGYSWSASVGYNRSTSNLDDKYTRTNLRYQGKYDLLKNLQLSADIYYTKTTNTSGKQGWGSITFAGDPLYPYARLMSDDNQPAIIPQLRQSYIDTAGNGRLLDWNYVPLEDYHYNKSNGQTSDILVNTGINFKPFAGLDFDIKYQYEKQNSSSRYLRDIESYYTRNLINRFTEIAGDEVTLHIPSGGILDLTSDVLETHSLRGQFNFQKKWNDHQVNLLGGGEVHNVNDQSNYHRTYGYDDDILTFDQVDYKTLFPDFVTGTLTLIPQNQGFDDKTTRFISAYVNGSYTFKSRYVLSGSARRDASNLFGLNTNDKWNLLWSGGVSWEISKESFFNSQAMPYLRLRTTYGYSGNIDPSMSAVTTIRYVGTSTRTPGAPYARPDQYANPDLKWETVSNLNIGVDFSLFENRLSGSVDYYKKTGRDLFGPENMDLTAGVGNFITKNAAKMEGRGLDFHLRSNNLRNGHSLSWSTELNFSYNKDKVLDYYLINTNGSNFIGGMSISAIQGRPVYALYSYRWAGLDPNTGDPRGYLNGEISNDYDQLTGPETQIQDLHYHGPVLPTFFGSFGNSFAYKNFTLDLWLSYKLGHFFRRASIDYGALFSGSATNDDFAKRWQKPGDESRTNVPSMIYPNPSYTRDVFYNSSEVTVEKADHIRLSYINLSYEILNKKRNSRNYIRSCSVYGNASNLGILWRANKEKLDPEVTGTNSYVPPMVFTIGIKMNTN